MGHDRIEHLILNSLFRDHDYLQRALSFLQPAHFQEPEERAIFELAKAFFEKHGKPPTIQAVRIEAERRLDLSDLAYDAVVQHPCLDVSTFVGAETATEWLVDATRRFCAHREFQAAILKSIDIFDGRDDTRNIEEIPDLMRDALNVGRDAPKVVTLDQVQRKAIAWLWCPYIAQGAITLLAGPGGRGKGLVATAIAAAVTRGAPLPVGGGVAPKGRVLWCEAEDGIAEVLKPRFEAAGGDCSMIKVIGPTDFAQLDLKAYIRAEGFVLVVMSPLPRFLKGLHNMNGELSARRAMERIQQAIEGTSCAVLAIAHINKNASLGAVERVLGAIGFVNFARSVLLVAPDDKEAETSRMVHAKHNLSSRGKDLIYWTEAVDDQGQDVRLGWCLAETDADVDSAYKTRAARPSAREWLHAFLNERGEVLKANVLSAGTSAGYSVSALEKAHTRGKFGSRREQEFQGQTWWFVNSPVVRPPGRPREQAQAPPTHPLSGTDQA